MTSSVGFLHLLVNASMLKGRHTKSTGSTTSGVGGDDDKMAAVKIGRSSSSSAVIRGRRTSGKRLDTAADWENGSFDRLLDSTIGLDLFTSFLRCERSEENIIFWRQCNFYRKAVNRKRLARIIYDEYIAESAPNEVNIDAAIRNDIKRRLVDAPLDLFDEAQRHVYQLMKRDSYKRFVVSRMYRTATEQHETNGNLERLRRDRTVAEKSQISSKPTMRYSWHGGRSSRSYDVTTPKSEGGPGRRVAAKGSVTGGIYAGRITDDSVRSAMTPEAHAKKKPRSVKKMLGQMVRNLTSKLSSAVEDRHNHSDCQPILGGTSATSNATTSFDLSNKSSGDVTLTSQCFDRLDAISTQSASEPMASKNRRQRRKSDSGSLVSCAVGSREMSLSSHINVFERRQNRSTFSGFKSKFEQLKRSVVEHRGDVIAAKGNASVVSSSGVSSTNDSFSSAVGADVDVKVVQRRSKRESNHFERSLATRQQLDRNVSSTPVARRRSAKPRNASRNETQSCHQDDSRRFTVYYL